MEWGWLKDAAQYALLTIGGAAEVAAYAWMIGENIVADAKRGRIEGANISGIDADAPRRLIYGERRVGGTITYACEKTALWPSLFPATGETSTRKFLLLNYTIAGHVCQQIGSMYFNDTTVSYDSDGFATGTLATYAKLIKAHQGYGTAQESAWLSELNSFSNGAWTEQHIQYNCSKAGVLLLADSTKFPDGIPNVTWLVQGKKVYDHRTDTTAYSVNPALCIRDFLLNTDWPGYALEAEIDEASFDAAANVCDEDVTIGASTEDRYKCNGVFDTSQSRHEILEALLSSCGGLLTYQGGKFYLYAATYRTPTLTFTESDFISPIRVGTKLPRTEICNGVRGTIVSATEGVEQDYCPVQDTDAVAADNGDELWIDANFPATTSHFAAIRMARIIMLQKRKEIRVQGRMSLTAMQFQVGDVIQLTISRYGWSSKVFDVIGWSLVQEADGALGVDVELRETASTIYDWSADYLTTLADNPATSLPDPSTVATPGNPAMSEELYETTGSAGLKTRVTMTWAGVADWQTQYQPEYKLTSGSTYTVLPLTSDTTSVINDLAPGAYTFRVKAINTFGASSAYATAAYTVVGLTAQPANVSGFSATVLNGRSLLLQWTRHTDLDVRIGGKIVIKWSTAGSTWEAGVDVATLPGDTTQHIVPLLDGTYLAKAQDSTGNWSATEQTVTVAVTDSLRFDDVETVTETFAGTHSGTYVDPSDSYLKLGFNVLDAGFESGDFGSWVNVAGGMCAVSSVDKKTGTYSLLFSGMEDGEGGYYTDVSRTAQGVSLAETTEYRFSAYVKGDFRLDGAADHLYMRVRNPGGSSIALQNISSVAYADWTKITLSFTTTTAGTYNIGFETTVAVGALVAAPYLYIDDVTLVPTSAREGTYTFANATDLGAVFTARIAANVTAVAYDVTDTIASRTALISTWPNITGAVIDGASVQAYYRTTQTDPAGSPSWTAWIPFLVAEVSAWGIQYKLVASVEDGSTDVSVSALSVDVDMAERTERGEDVSCDAAQETVTFTDPFKATPAIGIVVQGGATGDFYTIADKSASGFKITLKDSAGSAKAGTIDWIATGYGRAV